LQAQCGPEVLAFACGSGPCHPLLLGLSWLARRKPWSSRKISLQYNNAKKLIRGPEAFLAALDSSFDRCFTWPLRGELLFPGLVITRLRSVRDIVYYGMAMTASFGSCCFEFRILAPSSCSAVGQALRSPLRYLLRVNQGVACHQCSKEAVNQGTLRQTWYRWSLQLQLKL